MHGYTPRSMSLRFCWNSSSVINPAARSSTKSFSRSVALRFAAVASGAPELRARIGVSTSNSYLQESQIAPIWRDQNFPTHFGLSNAGLPSQIACRSILSVPNQPIGRGLVANEPQFGHSVAVFGTASPTTHDRLLSNCLALAFNLLG